MHAIAPRLVILLVGLPLALGAALLLVDARSGSRDAPGHGPPHGPTTLGTATSGAAPAAGDGAARRPSSAPPLSSLSASRARLRAASVLRSWDAGRAAAYARGDLTALRRLYTPGSEAGRADVRLLRSYLARGLRVDDLRVQLLSVRVVGPRSRPPGHLRLRVVDRVAGATVVDDETGTRQVLPRDRATERVVVLRRAATGAWRVASVSR